MNENVGKLILRLALGVLILCHGIAKLTGGIGGISGMVTAHGLPAFFAYGVLVGEVIAPLMILAGFYARIGAMIVVVNMLFAIWLVHRGDVFALNGQGGWAIELQGMYLFTALALVLIGSGKFGINAK
jgi:putative oxidoreductase